MDYTSPEWRSLRPDRRTDLLLVIEGVKPGAFTSSNRFTPNMITEAGLAFAYNSDPLLISPALRVAKQERLNAFERKYLTLPQGTDARIGWKIEGWFLGYPECCIAEYSRPRTEEEKVEKKRWRTYRFGREMEELYKKIHKFPEIFNYRPPTFTPCSIDCKEAVALLQIWKETLDAKDSEAAEALRISHFSEWV